MVLKSIIGATCACLAVVSFNISAAAISGQGTWETTLQGRDLDGDITTFEAYYDTVLDITWLADANAAGITMNWADANAWAAGLNINGYTGWRLPTVSPVNGESFSVGITTDGTTDRFYAATTTDGTDGGWRDSSGMPVSEMGHMYYVNLANLGECDPSLSIGLCFTPQPGYGLNNTGPFTNLEHVQPNNYWTNEVYHTVIDNLPRPWFFSFDAGGQTFDVNNRDAYSWAVHDGNVGVIPIPATVWLFGSGLLGLIGITRLKKA